MTKEEIYHKQKLLEAEIAEIAVKLQAIKLKEMGICVYFTDGVNGK